MLFIICSAEEIPMLNTDSILKWIYRITYNKHISNINWNYTSQPKTCHQFHQIQNTLSTPLRTSVKTAVTSTKKTSWKASIYYFTVTSNILKALLRRAIVKSLWNINKYGTSEWCAFIGRHSTVSSLYQEVPLFHVYSPIFKGGYEEGPWRWPQSTGEFMWGNTILDIEWLQIIQESVFWRKDQCGVTHKFSTAER